MRIYIDDSGEKEYGEKTSRYFVYAGVVVNRAEERALSDEIDSLKRETFGTANVEIKSNWLRQPKERKRRYCDPFGLTDDALTQFVDRVYTFMQSDRLTYVAAAVDKPQMIEKYGEKRYYPSALAYQFILQRYQKHCGQSGAVGYVTIDDMDGSSPKKNQWRALLSNQHERLKKDGCRFTALRFDNVAPRALFAASSRFNLLQIADLIAYNVFRQFRQYGDAWDRPNTAMLPVYGRLETVMGRFMRSVDGQVAGWGIVKWPKITSTRWGIQIT
jgi:hypothetical protein